MFSIPGFWMTGGSSPGPVLGSQPESPADAAAEKRAARAADLRPRPWQLPTDTPWPRSEGNRVEVTTVLEVDTSPSFGSGLVLRQYV